MNSEHPDLSYFEAGDHVMKLVGRRDRGPRNRRNATVREVAADQEVHNMIKKQGEQIPAQQKQIYSLLSIIQNKVGGRPQRKPRGSQRQCWICPSTEHLQRD